MGKGSSSQHYLPRPPDNLAINAEGICMSWKVRGAVEDFSFANDKNNDGIAES